jgi:hypothetical protein
MAFPELRNEYDLPQEHADSGCPFHVSPDAREKEFSGFIPLFRTTNSITISIGSGRITSLPGSFEHRMHEQGTLHLRLPRAVLPIDKPEEPVIVPADFISRDNPADDFLFCPGLSGNTPKGSEGNDTRKSSGNRELREDIKVVH